MAVDMTMVTVATIIGGVMSTIATKLFGNKRRPECLRAFDTLEGKVLKLQIDSARDSSEFRTYMAGFSVRLENIEKKLDRLIEGKIGHTA